jgi:hypothetical protein
MSDAIVYVDTSNVRKGALEQLKEGMNELVAFVEANEPQLITYNVHFSDDGTRMTVVHVHANADSLEYHLDVAGPMFRRFAHLVALTSIHIYGKPSEKALEQSQAKAQLLGQGAELRVDPPYAGVTGQVIRRTGEEELVTPPAGTTNGRAARAIAEVFGCSVEEAHRVLVLGIEARIAEQNARRAEQDPEHRDGLNG